MVYAHEGTLRARHLRNHATQLHLAEGTVRNYLSNVMQKTQTRTRHEAARYAREHDWM